MEELTVNNVSISVEFVRTAIEKTSLDSEQIDSLLGASRIPSALLQESNARVSLRQFANLVSMLIAISGDEFLGQTYKPVPVGSLSVLTHWLISSDNIGIAIERFAKFYQILEKGLDVEVAGQKQTMTISIHNGFHPKEANRFIGEFGLFHIHRMLCWLAKEIFPIEQLTFPFAKPSYVKDYRLMFYGAKMSFDAPSASITFAKSLFSRPILQTQESLAKLLCDPLKELLILKFQSRNWSGNILKLIHHRLDNLPSLPELAEELNIQPYTLQRRLNDEGLSYLAIKNQVKRDAAIEMLVHSRMSIEEISQRLGFAETSPFTRRFKEWTGVPPSAYRDVKAQN